MTPGARRVPGRLPLDTAAMYAAYRTGLDLKGVGRRFGCAGETVRRRFVAAGYPRRPALQFPGYRGADTAAASYAPPLNDHGETPLHRPGCPPRRVARCRAAAAAGWRVAAADARAIAATAAHPATDWRLAALAADLTGEDAAHEEAA